ncbi:MAG: V-type ATP synthase subunit F [Thermoplasmata archaeon]
MTLAVVGSEMFSLGFDLIGVQDIFDADENNAAGIMEELLFSKDFKLVIVEEKIMDALPRYLWHRAVNSTQPLFMVVGLGGEKVLAEKMKRAVGVDITGAKGGG